MAKEDSLVSAIMENGVLAIRAIIYILFTLFVMGWIGFEYYRAFPLEEHEVMGIQRLVYLIFSPAFLFLVFVYLKLVIDRQKYHFELAKYKGISVNELLNPPPVKEIPNEKTTPPTPLNPINTGVSVEGSNQTEMIGELVRNAILSYIKLNGSINFKDPAAIKRIESMVPGNPDKGEVDRELSRMLLSDEIVANSDGIVRINGSKSSQRQGNQPKEVVKESTSIGQPLTDSQTETINNLLGQIFSDSRELELQKNMLKTATQSEYGEIVHELKETISEMEAEKERAKRKELLRQEAERKKSMEQAGTVMEQTGNTLVDEVEQDETVAV